MEQRAHAYLENQKVTFELCVEALQSGCELLVIPELFSSGYLFPSFLDALQFAETSTGPTFYRIFELAKNYLATIVYGYVEYDQKTKRLHNSAAVVNQNGLVTNYRKLMTYVSDTIWATDGDQMPPIFQVNGVDATVMICADAEFPELSAQRNNFDPSIICLPTAWVDENCPSMTWWARVRESSSFMIAADLAGVEHGVQFSGGTSILSPSGDVLAKIDTGSGWISAELEFETRQSPKYETLSASLFLSTSTFSSQDLSIRVPTSIPGPRNGTLHIAALGGSNRQSLEEMCEVLANSSFFNQDISLGSDTLIVTIPSHLESDPSNDAAVDQLLAQTVQRCLKQTSYTDIIINVITQTLDGQKTYRSATRDQLHKSSLPDKLPVLQTAAGFPYSLLSCADLSSWSTCRDSSINGSLLLCISMSACVDWPVVKKQSSDIGLPPFPDHDLANTFNIARVRAGENNVAICVASSDSSATSIPSGVYGPDFFRYPYAESLMTPDQTGIHMTCLTVDNSPLLATNSETKNFSFVAYEKPYLRRRKPWIYASVQE